MGSSPKSPLITALSPPSHRARPRTCHPTTDSPLGLRSALYATTTSARCRWLSYHSTPLTPSIDAPLPRLVLCVPPVPTFFKTGGLTNNDRAPWQNLLRIEFKVKKRFNLESSTPTQVLKRLVCRETWKTLLLCLSLNVFLLGWMCYGYRIFWIFPLRLMLGLY